MMQTRFHQFLRKCHETYLLDWTKEATFIHKELSGSIIYNVRFALSPPGPAERINIHRQCSTWRPTLGLRSKLRSTSLFAANLSIVRLEYDLDIFKLNNWTACWRHFYKFCCLNLATLHLDVRLIGPSEILAKYLIFVPERQILSRFHRPRQWIPHYPTKSVQSLTL
jgi:hypothetical protein